MPETGKSNEDSEYPTDLLYGVLSVVNQFGGVLRERGQEYRKSSIGKLLSSRIDSMYSGINERERTILDVVLTSLDQLVTTIRTLDENLHNAAGTNGDANGHGSNGANRPATPDRSE